MGGVRLPGEFVEFLERRLSLSLRSPKKRELETIAGHVAEASFRLTRQSERAPFVSKPYLQEKALLHAYLLYYTPVNLPKIFHPLSEIAASGFFDRETSLRVLDIGAGTGALSLGTAFWLRRYTPSSSIHFTAVDQSRLALEETEAAFLELFPYPIETAVADLERPLNFGEHSYPLIVAGNLLNELSERAIQVVKATLARYLDERGFAIMIEPALKETSRTLLEFRNRMVESGWFVYAPCLTHLRCPALNHPEDWCHHTVEWERPPFIEWIDGRIGTIKRSLKFSYLVLAKRNVNLADYVFPQRDFENQFRVVSDRLDEKGRTRIFMCNDCGRNQVFMNTRDVTPVNRPLRALERYDVVEMKGLEKRKNDFRVGRDTLVAPVRPPAGSAFRDPGSGDPPP